MKTLLIVAVLFFAVSAQAQTTCFNFGSITNCSGPNNQSYTQVPTGLNTGVIIGDRDTQHYTLIQPVQPHVKGFDPRPLTQGPSTHQPTQPMQAPGMMVLPGMGPYGR